MLRRPAHGIPPPSLQFASPPMVTTLYALKPKFQELLRPLVGRLAAAGVTANQVTVLALAISVAAGAFVAVRSDAVRPFLLLPLVFLARMTLNAIDGMLAREFGQQSALGAYLNELADVVSDTALYLPFAFVAPFGPWSIGLVILASCVSEMAGVLGPMVGAARRFDGPMGKSDRALVFGALGLYVGLGYSLPDAAFWLLPALALLIGCNIVLRVHRGAASAREVPG
jgi:CDP-diacylglycerol--glycerol-3-phosphate 3-phosphatidyltransferase